MNMTPDELIAAKLHALDFWRKSGLPCPTRYLGFEIPPSIRIEREQRDGLGFEIPVSVRKTA